MAGTRTWRGKAGAVPTGALQQRGQFRGYAEEMEAIPVMPAIHAIAVSGATIDHF
jgi:hypothetical protein